MSMIVKHLIEELQKAAPLVGEDAPVTAGPMRILSVCLDRGRVTLEMPEPDEDDFPTFKDKLEAAETEAADAEEKFTDLKKLVSEYIGSLDIGAHEAAEWALKELREAIV